jgi:ribosome-interacting GTPase 1
LLDEFLQGIMEGLNDNKLFRQFLNVNNDTIQYKTQNVPKTQKRNPEIKVSSQRKVNPYDSIPETIWEGEIEEEDSLEH